MTQQAASSSGGSWSVLRITSCSRHYTNQTEEKFLDLVLTNAKKLVKMGKTGGTLDSSDHALVEFVI